MTEIAPRITIDPEVCHGKPVIKGTRILPEILLGHVAAGMTFEAVAMEYEVEVEDIRAALAFAASVVAKHWPRVPGAPSATL
jgi:uncharacterized protein (DUF433 family)